MSRRVCPNNPNHNTFITTAHVVEEWVVDEHGNFIEHCGEGALETAHGPSHDNVWECASCGCAATKEES